MTQARVTCYRCDPPHIGEWFELTSATALSDAFDEHVAEVHNPPQWLVGRDVEPDRSHRPTGRRRTGKARYAGS